MKHTLLIVAVATLTTLSGFAQGVFINSNRVTSQGLDAPVYEADGVTPLDSRYVAQVWAGATTGTLAPISNPAPFRDGAGAGYWNAPVEDRTEGIAVPDVAPGESAFVQVWVWGAEHASLDDARASGASFLSSYFFSAVPGFPGSEGPPAIPASPAALIGLQFPIPEPTTITLGTIGALFLGFRMRNRKLR